MSSDGIDVWVGARGGSVCGSEEAGQKSERTTGKVDVLAFTSINSSLVKPSPVMGSVPF